MDDDTNTNYSDEELLEMENRIRKLEKIIEDQAQEIAKLNQIIQELTNENAVLRNFIRPYVYSSCRDEYRHSKRYFIS